MSEQIRSTSPTGSWDVLAQGSWETADDLLLRLVDAVDELDAPEGTVLHDYVDIDAVLDALAPASASRGVSEVRFDYGHYEIKVTQAGTVAAAPDSGGIPQPAD